MSETSGTYRSNETHAVRRTELTFTPVPEEQAGRIGLATVARAGRSAATKGRDVLFPMLVLARGLRRCLGWFRAWWRRSGNDRRKLALVTAVVLVAVVLALPHGPWILAGAVMATATLAGRSPQGPKETPQQLTKLQGIYNGLVPYFMDPNDPDQLFQPGGDFRKPFDGWCFDEFGQLVKLELHYSPYFRDGEPEARAKVEQVIERRTGLSHDYMYEWNEEGNKLAVAVMPGARTARGTGAGAGAGANAGAGAGSVRGRGPAAPGPEAAEPAVPQPRERQHLPAPPPMPEAPAPRGSRAQAH